MKLIWYFTLLNARWKIFIKLAREICTFYVKTIQHFQIVNYSTVWIATDDSDTMIWIWPTPRLEMRAVQCRRTGPANKRRVTKHYATKASLFQCPFSVFRPRCSVEIPQPWVMGSAQTVVHLLSLIDPQVWIFTGYPGLASVRIHFPSPAPVSFHAGLSCVRDPFLPLLRCRSAEKTTGYLQFPVWRWAGSHVIC